MTKQLFLEDSYLKECAGKIVSVKDNKYVVLDQTIFYPRGGGQPCDTGKIICNDKTYNVLFVGKFDGNISHEVDAEGLKEGDEVVCHVDWERRYALMKAHTSAHLMSEVVHKETGALITGNQLDVDKVRIDFALEEFNKETMQEYIDKANALISQNLEISVSFMPREEAMNLPSVSKLAKGLPEHLKTLRIVNIGNVDVQADGGTHVKNSNEIGKIVLIKVDNKGKNNRRMYYKLENG